MAGDAKPRAAVALDPIAVGLHDAARLLGVSYWSVRDLVQAGALPVVKLPNRHGRDVRRILIAVDDIRALIARSRDVADGIDADRASAQAAVRLTRPISDRDSDRTQERPRHSRGRCANRV